MLSNRSWVLETATPVIDLLASELTMQILNDVLIQIGDETKPMASELELDVQSDHLITTQFRLHSRLTTLFAT